MRITTRIGLIIILPIIFGVAVVSVQLSTSATLREAQAYSKVTQDIQKSIFELNHLGSEVALYPNEIRARRQWLTKHQQITSLLAGADFKESAAQEILVRVNITDKQLVKLFNRLINTITAHQTADSVHIQEHEKSLLSFMLIKTQQMLSDIQQLHKLNTMRVAKLRAWSDTIILFIISSLAIITALFATILGRQIIQPLMRLHNGIKNISSGDLSYAIKINGRSDEFSELAKSFNHMGKQLQSTLASRDELNQEIEERKIVETALRSAHRRLQDILEFLPDATFVVDQNKQVIAWNRALEQLTGYSREHVSQMGKYAAAQAIYGKERITLIDLLDGTADPVSEALYDYVKKEDEKISAETYNPLLNNGQGAYVLISAAPLYDPANQRTGAIQTIQDISLLKQVEQERLKRLQQMQQQQKVLMELARHKAVTRGDLDAALALIIKQGVAHLKVERALVWLRQEGNSFRCHSSIIHNQAQQPSSEQSILLTDYPYYLNALNNNRIIESGDALNDSRYSEFIASYLKPQGVASLLHIPIRLGDTLNGIICFESSQQREWQNEEMSFAIELADQVAITLNNNLRRLNQEALQFSEEKLRDLLENLPQKIFYKDLKSHYLAVNSSYAKDFNLPPGEFIGKDDYHFYPEELASQYRKDDQRIIKSGKLEELDENYIRDGQRRIVHTVKAPVFNEQHEIQGVLGIFWDVTDAKMAEEEVARNRRYLQNVINSMPVILIDVDSETRISQWNQKAVEHSRISFKQARGKLLSEVLALPENIINTIKEGIDKSCLVHLPKQSHSLDSEPRHLDITIYPVSANGHSVIIINDITEQTHLETMMVQSEKMLSVGGLAAGMAHELNSPLGGMLQGLQNIRRRLTPELKKNIEAAAELGIDLQILQDYLRQRKINHLMDGISDAGKRATDIIDNMMRFSRTQQDIIAPVDLSQLLNDVLSLAALDYDMKKRYGFRDFKINRDFDTALPMVMCLEKEIKQVILSLLRNAAQAISSQRERTATPQISLQTRKEGNNAIIKVADNGPGMDDATCKRIFEPFYTTRQVGEGTGLGLSVAYFIIHSQHHGKLSVQSEPGKGTTFTIQLAIETAGFEHE